MLNPEVFVSVVAHTSLVDCSTNQVMLIIEWVTTDPLLYPINVLHIIGKIEGVCYAAASTKCTYTSEDIYCLLLKLKGAVIIQTQYL